MALINDDGLERELEELIAALDRRLPRVEQAGEIAIARDAAALREKAVNRLAEVRSERADVQPIASQQPSVNPARSIA